MTKYFAFISYKRGGLDEQVANWIHSKLEKYPYPVDMVSPNNRPEHESLIRRIYIKSTKVHPKSREREIDITIVYSTYDEIIKGFITNE